MGPTELSKFLLELWTAWNFMLCGILLDIVRLNLKLNGNVLERILTREHMSYFFFYKSVLDFFCQVLRKVWAGVLILTSSLLIFFNTAPN